MRSSTVLLVVVLAQCKGSSGPGPAALPSGQWTIPGPAAGARLPPFEAPDQDNERRAFDDLRGPNGLLLNFNRSVVW